VESITKGEEGSLIPLSSEINFKLKSDGSLKLATNGGTVALIKPMKQITDYRRDRAIFE
jgi:hypothetical protein